MVNKIFSTFDIRVVKLCDIRTFIENNHYSKNVNGLKTSLCIGLYIRDQLCGACLFGSLSTTTWKNMLIRKIR